ncbi:MAG: BolA protein [Alteromonadaceae bacterium]|jgi:BolA protein
MTIETVIEEKLLSAFLPRYLDVINETYLRKLPAIIKSNFKIIIISRVFEGKKIKQRHSAINKVLAEELNDNISALTLHSYTEKEWHKYYVNSLPLSAHCLTQ